MLTKVTYYSGWLRIEDAAEYAGVGRGQIDQWRAEGLRYIQRKKTILIKPEWIDRFLERYEVNATDIKRLVDEVCNKKRKSA